MAVLAGYLAMAGLSALGTLGLAVVVPESFDYDALAYVPPWDTAMVASAFCFAIVAGFVTGLVARRAELAHALGLAALGFSMWIVYFFSSPDAVSSSYQLSLQVVGVVGVPIGAGLRTLQRARREKAENGDGVSST